MIELDAVLVKEMTEHARRDFPHEACGIVASAAGRPIKVFTMSNADRSPYTYRLDPKEQLQVFDEIEREGWELFGIYHSHTKTDAYPSETDLRLAFYPQAHYLIVSLQDPESPELRCHRIVDGVVDEEEVRVL